MRSMVLLLVTGCTMETELRYLSTVPTEVNGLVFSEDGVEAYVAMQGTTCTIETAWGCPVADVDLPTEEEKIVDHHQGRTLAVSARGVHQLVEGAWKRSADLEVERVHLARFGRDELLVVREAGASCVFQVGHGASIVLEPDWCAEGRATAVDRASDTLWMADGVRVARVSPDGAWAFPAREDLLDHDPATGLLYLATSGSRQLRAVDAGGNTAWKTYTRGPISSIATRGGRADLLVLQWDGPVGLLERRDGMSGRLLDSYPLPGADGELVVSANGVGIAIVVDGAVHHYVVAVPGEEVPINEQPRSCIEMLDRTVVD